MANILINTVVIFLGIYLILSFIAYKPVLAVIPAIIYLLFTAIKRLPSSKLDIVEKAYPVLRGKLSTASDNKDADSPIATELEEECVTDIKNIKTSEFIDFNAILKKSGLILFFGFVIVLLSSYAITLQSTATQLADFLGISGRFWTGENGGSQIDQEDQPFNLYDESATEAFMGTDPLSLEIPVPESVKVDQFELVKDRDFEETFPQELFSEGSEAYTDEIADEHRAIIKQYFSSVVKR